MYISLTIKGCNTFYMHKIYLAEYVSLALGLGIEKVSFFIMCD